MLITSSLEQSVRSSYDTKPQPSVLPPSIDDILKQMGITPSLSEGTLMLCTSVNVSDGNTPIRKEEQTTQVTPSESTKHIPTVPPRTSSIAHDDTKPQASTTITPITVAQPDIKNLRPFTSPRKVTIVAPEERHPVEVSDI
jgi:hypothetical protein